MTVNTQDELISIIIPVYKVEKYLEKCINSIIGQTYTNLQIILVDDGSPDNSGKICDKYAKKDSRVEVIHKSNGGLSEARNSGIERAKGKYIGFVDSDDYIKEDMYEVLYNLITRFQADVSICNLYDVVGDEKNIRNINEGIKEYNRIDILKEVLMDKNIQSYAWNKLYKKELFDNIKYPIGRKYEDIGTTFYVLEQCKKVVVTGSAEYFYLKREDSLVSDVTESTILDYIDLIIDRYLYVKNNIKELEKYNDYYLVKTLITAYNDIGSIKNVSIKTKIKYDYLYNLSNEVIINNKENIEELFTQEQIKKLNEIIENKIY